MALPCSEAACCFCSSPWQEPHCTGATPGSCGRSLPSSEAWQLVQESGPCTEAANFLASTNRETVRLPRFTVMVLSLWQARQSSLDGPAARTVGVAVAKSNSAVHTSVAVHRFGDVDIGNSLLTGAAESQMTLYLRGKKNIRAVSHNTGARDSGHKVRVKGTKGNATSKRQGTVVRAEARFSGGASRSYEGGGCAPILRRERGRRLHADLR